MASQPNLQDGIDYWKAQPASLDGVLGGFGSGSLPRIDSLGSRQFLLHLIPNLSTVPSAIRPLALAHSDLPGRRTRALDVGAGIGRVTSDVLLHLVSDVVLLEPVPSFVQEAYALGRTSENPDASPGGARWKGILDKSKGVTFLQGTLQSFDPGAPRENTQLIGRVGHEPAAEDLGSGFDVIWCQWCLGHLSDDDLVVFFQRCKRSLRPAQDVGSGESVIVVKENVCANHVDGRPRTVFDRDDSSLTRSDLAWKKVFVDAGLRLVAERVQLGLPAFLYDVKMYALR